MKARSSMVGYPPGWEKLSSHVQKINDGASDCFKDMASINRFAARYRAAKLYTSCSFEGMTPSLSDGYSGLMQVMLVYSAFEFWLKALGIKKSQSHTLLRMHDTEAWAREIRKIDPGMTMYRHCLNFLDRSHQNEINKFIRCEPFNYIHLAASIRHSFAHGYLTPNGGGAEPESVIAICSKVAGTLMTIIDSSFKEKIDQLDQGAKG